MDANDEKLREIVFETIERRYPDRAGWTLHYDERLEKELGVISKRGFSEAFYIITDIINYIRCFERENSEDPCYVVGPGRGAAASSLVCFLLGITAVDPMKNGLIFEGFINDLEDNEICIDIDIGVERLNFRTIVKYAEQIHRDNLVIKSISPCIIRMKIGSVQFNILQLSTIRDIDKCLLLIYKNHGKSIDIEKVPFLNEVFENIYCAGKTESVFHFNSDSLHELLLKYQPKNIEDLTLLISVCRPGLIDKIGGFLSARNTIASPEYISHGLDGILSNTYGVPVYQEQIIRILHELAGFSLCEADIVRRAMSKKKHELLTSYEERFIHHLVQNGESAQIADRLWNWHIEHTCYTFNKSHAVAYAYLSYYTAWLKYYYPEEFSACFNSKNDVAL